MLIQPYHSVQVLDISGICGVAGGGTSCHTDPDRYWNWGYYMAK